MPVVLTSEVSFQGLQAALTQAKASLDKVYQISSALEARASKAEQATQAPSGAGPAPAAPPLTTPTVVPVQESFEQSIAEMRRIAGFK
jgi:hypothetical protein